MNTTTLTPNLVEPALAGEAKSFVGLHIGNDKTGLVFSQCSMFSPPDNIVALMLLSQLLRRVLEHADLIASPVAFTGSMGDYILMVAVTDALAAVEIIKPELEAVLLLPYVQIGIQDGSGDGRWRCVYPHTSINMNALMDTERYELHAVRFMEKLRANLQFAADLARMALAGSDLAPEQREVFANTLRTAEAELAKLPPPSNPEAQ